MLSFNEFNIKEYEAHLGELLIDHLRFVWNENKKIWKWILIDWINLWDIFYLVWVLHDIGKYTKIFQYHLYTQWKYDNNDIDTIELIDSYKQHAVFWAFFYFYIIVLNKEYLNKLYNESLIGALILWWFYAIYKHHWDLEDLSEIDDIDWINNKTSLIKKQIYYIDNHVFDDEVWKLISDIWFSISYDDYVKFVNNVLFEKIALKLKELIKLVRNNDKYINLIKVIYSSLIFSDKYKTIFWDCEIYGYNKFNLNSDLIDRYRMDKWFINTTNELNIFRNEIYDNVGVSLSKIDIAKHIYTLNAPTWSGKTFNLINIWLKLKSKLLNLGVNSKIVYGLPYTSIIDQVYNEIQDILNSSWIDINQNNLLFKHHHLAEITLENVDNRLWIDYSKLKFLLNSWDSEIIVTTFYQIFNTIFWNKNKLLIKFISFQNTIFLLDEIQSMPYKYWWSIKHILKILSEQLNCYFVLSSATLPLIFDNSESIELLSNNSEYFFHTQMNRTCLDLQLFNEAITIDKLFEHIKLSLIQNPNKNHLLTFNTIKSSIIIFNKIKEEFFNNSLVIYMSSNIIPIHRKQRIEFIKSNIKNKNSKRVILVSTQIIEAWVDLDFDIWFRDFWPIDSIVQVAWRLNRNWLSEIWVLKIFRLLDTDKIEFSTYIYSKLLLELTKELFWLDKIIFEKDYKCLFDKYFKLIEEKRWKDIESNIIKNWNELNFKGINDWFTLIDQYRETVNIFVLVDETAKNLFNKYMNIKESKSLSKWEKKENWDKIRSQFNQYIISVWKDKISNLWFDNSQLENWLICLKDEFLDMYYDIDIWFNINLVNDNFI